MVCCLRFLGKKRESRGKRAKRRAGIRKTWKWEWKLREIFMCKWTGSSRKREKEKGLDLIIILSLFQIYPLFVTDPS